jgi:hypothetical protein
MARLALAVLVSANLLLTGQAAHAEDDYSIGAASNEQIRSIKAGIDYGLKSIGSHAHALNCSLTLAHLIGGTLENTVYGAVCRLTNGHDVVFCVDPVFGDFALSTTFGTSKDEIIDFMQNNCPGG